MICLVEEVFVPTPSPRAIAPTEDEVQEWRTLYVDRRQRFEQIARAHSRPVTWQQVLEAVLPGVRAPAKLGAPPICTTCDRDVVATRGILRERFTTPPGQRKKQRIRAVPVPAYCLYCACPRAAEVVEQAKSESRRYHNLMDADRTVAHRIAHRAVGQE